MHRYKSILIYYFLIFTACQSSGHKDGIMNDIPQGIKKPGSYDIYHESLFGGIYFSQGGFLSDPNKNIETNLWIFTDLKNPLVFSGNFFNGMQTGVWKFISKDGMTISSEWNIYNNNISKCSFSLPFDYEQLYIDSFTVKLSTKNDSIGKIGIVVQIRDTILKGKSLSEFGLKAVNELNEQGYTLNLKRKEILKDSNTYYLDEFFLRDSINKEAKVYNLYGNTLSQKHFVLLTLFHQGSREDLVQIIFNMIGTSLYINNERFYNPYTIKAN